MPVPPTKFTASIPLAVKAGVSPVAPLAPIYQNLKVLFIEIIAELLGIFVPLLDKSKPLSISKYKFLTFIYSPVGPLIFEYKPTVVLDGPIAPVAPVAPVPPKNTGCTFLNDLIKIYIYIYVL